MHSIASRSYHKPRWCDHYNVCCPENRCRLCTNHPNNIGCCYKLQPGHNHCNPNDTLLPCYHCIASFLAYIRKLYKNQCQNHSKYSTDRWKTPNHHRSIYTPGVYYPNNVWHQVRIHNCSKYRWNSIGCCHSSPFAIGSQNWWVDTRWRWMVLHTP